MGDITVQRGTAAIGSGGGTAAPPITFGSLASTIVWNRNNRRMHGGRDDQNAGNLEGDDMSGGIHLASTSQIDFDREGASQASSMRFAWESWEYTGAPGGLHEFIVRGRFQLTLTGNSTTAAVSGIADIDRCIPIITGLLTTQTTDSADAATAIAWLSSGTLNVKRGAASTGTTRVYVTVVEFTGAAWQLAHGRLESNADSGSISLVDAADGQTAGGGDIADWSQAHIHHQFVGNQLNNVDDAISDTSARYEPGGDTSTVDFDFDPNHVDAGGAGSRAEHFVHVLRNTSMVVTRFSDTQSLGSAMNVDISSAGLSNLSEASIDVSRTSSGTGTAYGRGWVNAQLTSTTNAELWVHRSGNTINTRIEVIDLVNLGPIGITDLDDEVIGVGENDNTITGFGFGAIQGTGLVELADSGDYGTATRVTQTIDTWSDTSIQFDSVGGIAEGTAFVFVTNDNGERSGAYRVTYGSPPYNEIVGALAPDHHWQLDNNYNDSAGDRPMTTDIVGTQTFVTAPICEKNTHTWQIDDVLDRRGVADTANMNLAGLTARTMGGWIQLGGIQQSLAAIYKEGGAVNNLAFLVGLGNTLVAQLADTSDDQAQAYSDFRLTAQRPYHIAFRYDYGVGTPEFRLLIDGVVQTVTDGNPLTSTDLDSHSGDINWGDPDNNLEMGGTDIAFAGPEDCQYAQWATWRVALTDADVRNELFEKGALPTVTITAGTTAAMQTQLDALASTLRPDAPLAIRVQQATDAANFELVANDVTFDPRCSIHLQYVGSGVLTWVNGGTSDASILSTPNGGTISLVETVPVTLTVRDITDSSVVQDARVLLEAAAGGPLAVGTDIISGTTDVAGQISTELRFSTDQPVTGRVRRASTGTRYKTSAISSTVTSAGLDLTVFLIRDE
ncbi:MAG: hypothetical protein AAGE52_01290 [Myxococcota bacterium]